MNEKERQGAVLEEKKGNFAALLPIIVFLVLFIGSGIITEDFYAMPTIVAFLIALGVAFVQNPKLKFNFDFPETFSNFRNHSPIISNYHSQQQNKYVKLDAY